MFKIGNKKGLSDVVTTVLIILLVLAAVVIIWSFVLPAIQSGGEQIEDQTACIGIDVTVGSCVTTVSSGTGAPNNIPIDVTSKSSKVTQAKIIAFSELDGKGTADITAAAPTAVSQFSTLKLYSVTNDATNGIELLNGDIKSASVVPYVGDIQCAPVKAVPCA